MCMYRFFAKGAYSKACTSSTQWSSDDAETGARVLWLLALPTKATEMILHIDRHTYKYMRGRHSLVWTSKPGGKLQTNWTGGP